MSLNVSLKCSCGAFRGLAMGVSQTTGRRIVCLCDDCQAYAHFLGRAKDILDENGGTDVFPVVPSHLKITQGMEHLRCLRLSAKGMFRWYAGCCKTPIANSMDSHKVPYAGVIHTIMDHAADAKTRDEALGPVFARVQGKYGLGNMPENTYKTAPLALILNTLLFLLKGWLRGQYKPSPFFDEKTGEPKAKPYVLTPVEREGLRKFCGPQKKASIHQMDRGGNSGKLYT